MHRLNIKAGAKPVKQPQRRFRPDIMDAIEQQVRKLIDSGFIREEQHPDWVSNIISITKKNGSIRICIGFRNLNDACPKDEFLLPVTDIMVDNTAGYERMSFIDGFSSTIKSTCTRMTRGTLPSGHLLECSATQYALWIKECQRNLSTGNV